MSPRQRRSIFGHIHWRYVPKGIVRPVMVIVIHPDLCLLPYLIDILKNVLVKDTAPVGPVEPFDKCVLRGFAGLNVLEPYPMHQTPVLGYMGNEFGAIVHSYLFRPSFFIDQVVKYPNNAVTGKGEIDLYMDGFPVKIVDNVERPETPTVLQYIGHKINTPGMVRFTGYFQRFFDPGR